MVDDNGYDDDGEYQDWKDKRFGDLAVAFAEEMEDEFDEYCFKRWQQEKEEPEDDNG